MAKEISSLARGYLVLYNTVLSLGWLVVLVQLCLHMVRTNGDYAGVYRAVELPLQIFQTAAILEVVHTMIGIVPSSTVVTFVQVQSRLVGLWAVLHATPGVSDSIGPVLMITCWSLAEIVRYAFYVCSLLQSMPYIVLWCRYTFFFLLYPLGVTGELICMYVALPVVKATGQFSFRLPNIYNISFDFYTFLIFYAIMYIPVFPQLYLHMISQRGKMLGKAKTA